MNAYELADHLDKANYFGASLSAAMLRQQADQLDKVIPQLVKANGLIENLRIRIAELEKWEERWSKRCQRQQDRIAELEKLAEEMKYEKSSGVYTHPVKQLSDEEIVLMYYHPDFRYEDGMLNYMKFARAIIKEIIE